MQTDFRQTGMIFGENAIGLANLRKHRYGIRVNILKYVKTNEKWRFANVVEKNGKVVRDHVLISGRDEHHPEGTYYRATREIRS